MRVLLSTLVIVMTAGACQENTSVDVSYLAAPRADIQLKQAAATLTNTSDTLWTLDKVGSLGGATITWQATATQGATTPGLLIFNGIFRVENKGNAGATIGNIVVNLQKKVGTKWVTVSSDIADGTQDDNATTANVASKASSEGLSTFTENTASGSLVFTDATTNSAFALVPQVTIAPKTVQKLRFSATFDNNVLALATGTQVRAEIIVSFGNARAGGSSTPSVDINGNGIIDADEVWIQSVQSRIVTIVPAQQPSNATVTLTDTPSDITTTGTVTFSNPVITINGLQAFVVVNYDGGASGGTITNCAHLTGTGSTSNVLGDEFTNLTSLDLTACSTITVGPHTCSPGLPGCGWEAGDVVSYSQDSWGGDPTSSTAAGLLVSNFDTVYGGGVEVGISGNAGFSMIFTSVAAVLNYQPSSGSPSSLNADLIDPTSTSSGLLGGFVLALQFNVDFTDLGLVSGSSSLRYGDLYLCGLTDTPAYNGLTIRQLLAAMNTALGGGPVAYSYDAVAALTSDVTAAFEGGAPSLFAQQHIFSTPCP
jgi:hypothetical protein